MNLSFGKHLQNITSSSQKSHTALIIFNVPVIPIGVTTLEDTVEDDHAAIEPTATMAETVPEVQPSSDQPSSSAGFASVVSPRGQAAAEFLASIWCQGLEGKSHTER